MEFSDILASTVHDIKNSLGMMINTLEELTEEPNSGLADNPKAMALQYEARRANNNLIQLLTLYKFQNERIGANIAEHNVEDFLDEIVIENRCLATSRGIQIEYQCDPCLSAFFDEDLVQGVLNNAIGNAERYTHNLLILSADVEDGFTVIRVEDNGAGFPKEMLDIQDNKDCSEGFTRGRTRLGLYFSDKMAKVHRKDDRRGFIRLENGFRLQGGCFSLWLP